MSSTATQSQSVSFTVADIGKVIAFLVSDDSAWITGQDIQASGGYSL